MDAAGGIAITLWTIRVSGLCYVASLLPVKPSRWLWTAGCAAYLAHAAAAFHFHHGWSHAAAYEETARQTRAMFGSAAGSGAGLYFNYLFTAVWLADVGWWWSRPEGYARRPWWLAAAVHAFLAFLFFNGAVVFARGATRSVGAVATVAVLAAAWRRRRTN